MSIGKSEKVTQNRVIQFFVDDLGYKYLGDLTDCHDNSNIEQIYLRAFLQKQGYSDALIEKALFELQKVAQNQNRSLYDVNKEVYSMLR
jgi:type I restriction enzyme R subunit